MMHHCIAQVSSPDTAHLLSGNSPALLHPLLPSVLMLGDPASLWGSSGGGEGRGSRWDREEKGWREILSEHPTFFFLMLLIKV